MKKHLRWMRLGGNAAIRRNGYRFTRQSHRNTNSEYRLCTGGPRLRKVQHPIYMLTRHATRLTSLNSSYTVYRFRMNPCWPNIFTLIFSNFFHQSLGIPVPL